jgi:hypothetical protein
MAVQERWIKESNWCEYSTEWENNEVSGSVCPHVVILQDMRVR